LVDNVLNTTTALTPGTTYDFAINSTPSSQGNARFAINLKTSGALSVAQNALDSGIQVYPNPSHGQFNISNTQDAASTIEISNLNGQVILSQKLNSGTATTIQTNGWATGVYLLKAASNGVQTTKKLIIQ
jgi:trimeric autotransporter adhesin